MLSNGSEPRGLRIDESLTIPFDELVIRTTVSGGPGGQHANRSRTRVEVVFDIVASPTLADHQRALLVGRFGSEVRVGCSDERSQRRNRDVAFARLAERIADALRVAPPRRPTRPTKASVRRRLEGKKRNAERRAGKQIRPDD